MLQIKYEAFRQNLTNREISKRAEISEESLSRIISGKQSPGFKRGQSAERIARAVGWKGDVRALFAEVEAD